jgi:parallel beta-helix repeat protein
VTISGLSISGTKGGNRCKPACGGAIKKDGRNLHVLNVRLHHNANQGIGNPGPGFLLQNSEIDHNGSAAFTNGSASSAGVKVTQGPATFRNNSIHYNYWQGLWYDGFAASIVISGNVVHHNGKSGIRYEVCRGPGSKITSKITKNRVFHNGYLRQHISRGRGGIVLAGARGVEVANNTVTGNREHGIRAKASDRQRTSKVNIHHNSLRKYTLQGCQLPGVLCRANRT